MAWISDDWKQDDDAFYGYPIPVSVVGVPNSPDVSGFNHRWLFDDAFYGYPHVVRLTNNPYNIYLGELDVDEIYIGEELIWKNDGVNKIIINLLEGS